MLLVVALSAFVVDRVAARCATATRRRGSMLLALVPAMLVIAPARPRHRRWSTSSIALAVLFVAGTPWRHFAALGALVAVAIALDARGRAGGRRARAQALPGGPPDGVPATRPTNPADAGLPAEPVADRDRRGREDRPRRRHATQTQLNFLPEHHTDFIFAVVGERYGFVGAALVLSLYALLIWRGLRILTMAKNLYGALIAGGIVAMLHVPGLRQRRA